MSHNPPATDLVFAIHEFCASHSMPRRSNYASRLGKALRELEDELASLRAKHETHPTTRRTHSRSP